MTEEPYRLRKKDIGKASEVLGRAFFDDPDISEFLPDERMRRDKLKLLPMLKRRDKEDLPVMLETNKAANVTYHESYGFEVKRTCRVLDNDHLGIVRYPHREALSF